MMKPLAKRLGAFILAAAGVAAALFSAAVWIGERKMHRPVDVRVVPVAYARDAAALARGKQLYESRGCASCHGEDGRGRVLLEGPGELLVRAPNITRGPSGVVAGYTEADWVRTVRHGVAPGRRALLVMPSEHYSQWSDAELAALVAHVRALPPAEGEPGLVRLPAHVKALYGAGALRDAAEKIDHRHPTSTPAQPAPESGDPYVAIVEEVRRLAALELGAPRPRAP